ncbi:MAG TPA: tetratricopeptide repeat protein [Acidobacteriota bacterium]|nr:tetratricopeptide repeat protein [Acidobacteriota bacterium]
MIPRTLTLILLALLLVPAWAKDVAADGPVFASAQHSPETLEMAELVLHGLEISQPKALLAPMAQQALRGAPSDALAHYLTALTAPTSQEAQQALESAYWMAASSSAPERLFLKAQCLRGRGETSAAVALLTRLAAERPHRRMLLMALGETLIEDGQPEQARVFLEQARRLGPDTSRVYLLLGRTHLESGQSEQASQAFRAALQRMHPQADPAVPYSGLILAALTQDPPQVRPLVDEYLERCRTNPWAQDPWQPVWPEELDTPIFLDAEDAIQ